jgi:hypothetical protein
VQEGIPGLFPKTAIGSGMKKESVRATSDACPCWHTPYQAALFETDRHEIPERIEQAERAVVRVKELFVVTSDHIEEDQVLDDALYALRDLRNCVFHQNTAA